MAGCVFKGFGVVRPIKSLMYFVFSKFYVAFITTDNMPPPAVVMVVPAFVKVMAHVRRIWRQAFPLITPRYGRGQALPGSTPCRRMVC